MDEEGEPLRLSLGQKAAALGRALRPAYWQALAVVVLLYQARFDVSFIMIHAAAVRPARVLMISSPGFGAWGRWRQPTTCSSHPMPVMPPPRSDVVPRPPPLALPPRPPQVMPRERLAVLNVFSMLPVVLLVRGLGVGGGGLRERRGGARTHPVPSAVSKPRAGWRLLRLMVRVACGAVEVTSCNPRPPTTCTTARPARPRQATPMGIQAKKSVAARNAVLLLGFAVLVAGNLCYAFVPSELGERWRWSWWRLAWSRCWALGAAGRLPPEPGARSAPAAGWCTAALLWPCARRLAAARAQTAKLLPRASLSQAWRWAARAWGCTWP